MNLHQLFQQQAKHTPDAPAVVDSGRTVSYAQLDRITDSLAGFLHRQGIGKDGIAGIFMEKCSDYILAYLAALKAGGAYMPLDLAHPPELLKKIVDEARPKVIITKTTHASRLSTDSSTLILNIDSDESWKSHTCDTAASQTTPDDLAFVIYSSGTTGEPKGILMPHRGAMHSYQCRYEFSTYRPEDRVACSIFFVWELLRPLLKGVAVYVIPDDIIYDPLPLLNFIERHQITEILFTPSLLETLINVIDRDLLRSKLNSLRVLWLNGEVVTTRLKHRMIEALPSHIRLLNTYSISECHDVANSDLRDCTDPLAGICPVGRPIPGVEVRVVNDQLEDLPAGWTGELYVSGPGLARGYLNNPALTAERFVNHAGGRYYRTGDRAIRHDDGQLEIQGRCDSMAKIRGYSINLGAVETVLREHANVHSCAVVTEGETGEDQRLVAYVVRNRRATWQVDQDTGTCVQIQNRIKPYLAHYMVPNVYVELDSIPVHPVTGKLNADRLPVPPQRRHRYAVRDIRLSDRPTREEQHEVMQRLWGYLLQIDAGSINRDSNFFDLGGHSLLAVELSCLIEEIFKVELMVKDIYEYPTVRQLVGHINDDSKGSSHTASLRRDARLDESIIPAADSKPLSLEDAGTVFLTGATGFLGAFLLDELLRNTSDRVSIHCLVRTKSGNPRDGLKRIVNNLNHYGLWQPGYDERIEPVVGDLTQPRLDLSPEHFDGYAREIDFIFHCAALVNYVYSYPILKPGMVNGTQEVLRFACSQVVKPMHYISTNGIFPGNDEQPYRENSDIDAFAERLEGGYGPAKWVAEKLVWQAVERGLPVCLYRPGNIGHHSLTGTANPQDFQFMMIEASRKIGCAPRNDEWAFEMTPIDFLVKTIVRFAKDPHHFGHVYNAVNPHPLPARKVFELMAEQNLIAETVSVEEWRARLTEKARREGDQILGVLAQSLDDVEMYLQDKSVYDCSQFEAALSKHDLQRPVTDRRYFANVLKNE